jgi:hypothetical protein
MSQTLFVYYAAFHLSKTGIYPPHLQIAWGWVSTSAAQTAVIPVETLLKASRAEQNKRKV